MLSTRLLINLTQIMRFENEGVYEFRLYGKVKDQEHELIVSRRLLIVRVTPNPQEAVANREQPAQAMAKAMNKVENPKKKIKDFIKGGPKKA